MSYSSLTITGSMASPLLIKCSKNLLKHIPSCTAASNTKNSASIIDRTMQDCLLLLQDMAPLLSKNVNPEVDFLSSKSPP